MKVLLDAGADPKALSAARASALRAAAAVGEVESMRLLIAAGADLRADAAAALNASLVSRCRACADLVIGALDARVIRCLTREEYGTWSQRNWRTARGT